MKNIHLLKGISCNVFLQDGINEVFDFISNAIGRLENSNLEFAHIKVFITFIIFTQKCISFILYWTNLKTF